MDEDFFGASLINRVEISLRSTLYLLKIIKRILTAA